MFINGWVVPSFTFQFLWKKAVRLGFCFSYCSLKRLGLPTNLLLLSLPLCPDPQQLQHRGGGRERTAGGPEGSASPASVSCLPLMKWPATIPMLSKKVEKNTCHSTNSRSIYHCPQWLSLQTPILKLMFWYLLGFLLCPVSEFQQVKDNKILSLAQLVINSTKKSFSLALPLIASLKGL